MNKEIDTRLRWIKHYQTPGTFGITCQRCGISRPTLRKWLKQYEELGIHGLVSKSRRPKNSPHKKVNEELEHQILSPRLGSNLGARRIQNELKRQHQLSLSLATIHDVLFRNEAKPLCRPKRRKKIPRYSRLQAIEIYPTRTVANTLLFLENVVEEMRFPVQSIQTDHGTKFFSYKVQEQLGQYCIRFHPIRPGQPHLNCKVERVRQTDLKEICSCHDYLASFLGNT